MVAKRKLSFSPSMVTTNKRTKAVTLKPAIAKAVRSTVARMAEKKALYNSVTEVSVSSSSLGSNWYPLSAIPQGVGHGERVGRQIKLDSLKINQVFKNNSTGTHLVRILVGYIKDQSTMGTGTELFENLLSAAPTTPLGIGGGNGMLALVSPINKAKFTVLYDKVITVGAAASVDGADTRQLITNHKLKGALINFEASTSGAANQDRSLYIGAFTVESGNDTAGGTSVEWTLFAETHYHDL